MSNECNCQIPNTDIGGRCFKCGGFVEMPISKPMTNEERIKADADNHVKGLSIQHSKAHQHAGYIVGATDVYERAKPMEDVLQYIIHCPAIYDKKELLKWIDSAIEKSKVALEQWKSGKGKEVGDE